MTQIGHDELDRIVGRAVSRETFDSLLAFQRRFEKWSIAINLAAPSTIPQLWARHILDSAQLLRLQPQARKWLDIGSGGGFPGMVIAILLRDRPDARVDLVESNRKKAAFLATTAKEVGAVASIHACRIEDAPQRVEQPDVITARALAPLPKLLGLSSHWLRGRATGLFHKGRDYRSEVQESINLWRFDLVEHRSAVDPDGVVLEITNLSVRSEA